MGFDFTVSLPCDKPPPKSNQQSFPQIANSVCTPVGLLLAHSSAGFVKTSQHLVLLFLAVLSHSLMRVKITMFVTVNFASLCLKSKGKKKPCNVSLLQKKRGVRRLFLLNTFLCNACTYFAFSVTCGLFNYPMAI